MDWPDLIKKLSELPFTTLAGIVCTELIRRFLPGSFFLEKSQIVTWAIRGKKQLFQNYYNDNFSKNIAPAKVFFPARYSSRLFHSNNSYSGYVVDHPISSCSGYISNKSGRQLKDVDVVFNFGDSKKNGAFVPIIAWKSQFHSAIRHQPIFDERYMLHGQLRMNIPTLEISQSFKIDFLLDTQHIQDLVKVGSSHQATKGISVSDYIWDIVLRLLLISSVAIVGSILIDF